MKAFAIKRLDSNLYWTGKKWGPLNKAKEWCKLKTAEKHAKEISKRHVGVYMATVQTV